MQATGCIDLSLLLMQHTDPSTNAATAVRELCCQRDCVPTFATPTRGQLRRNLRTQCGQLWRGGAVVAPARLSPALAFLHRFLHQRSATVGLRRWSLFVSNRGWSPIKRQRPWFVFSKQEPRLSVCLQYCVTTKHRTPEPQDTLRTPPGCRARLRDTFTCNVFHPKCIMQRRIHINSHMCRLTSACFQSS